MGQRVNVLKQTVGANGASAAAAALLDKGFVAYASLLRAKGDDLESTVAELESKMEVVERDIQTLESQVSGKLASLLSTSGERGISIEDRVAQLEREVSMARTRVTAI